MKQRTRRNPDIVGDLANLALMVAVGVIGYEVVRSKVPSLALPDPSKIIGDIGGQVAHDAGVGGSQVVYTATGVPTQALVDTVSPGQLETNWEQWKAGSPFGMYWPATLNDMVDKWFNGAGGTIFGLGSYDPTVWGAFTSNAIGQYKFVLPSKSLSHFDERSLPLGGTK